MTKTTLQLKALKWFEKNGFYWSVYYHPDHNCEGFRCQWIDGDLVNWIDDASQPPYKYRVGKKTEQSLALLKHMKIPMEECRF